MTSSVYETTLNYRAHRITHVPIVTHNYLSVTQIKNTVEHVDIRTSLFLKNL